MSINILGKSQLIKRVADSSEGYTQKQVSEVLDASIAEILKAVSEGLDVRLTGFLTIGSKHRKARSGRNPKTGEVIDIPAKTVPSLKAGKELKDSAESVS